MARTGVIGGGLAGLTVAFRRLAAGDDVVVFEGAPASRLGGQLWTERADGFVVEHGAEGFVAGSESLPVLAGDLGIAEDLVGQVETRSFGFDGRALIALGPGEAAKFLGFQVARDEMGRGIRTFRLGMGQLSERLAEVVRPRATLHAAKARAVRSRGGRLEIAVSEEVSEEVDAVVVATSAAAASSLLDGLAGEPAAALAAATTSSSCTVTAAFPRDAIEHPLDGTGFVVASAHQVDGFRACTFVTSKFSGRAPDGVAVLRAFFRPSEEDLATMTDDAWTARTEERLRAVLPIRGGAARSWVSRWSRALPVFSPAHIERVRALESVLGPHRVRLAGSAFHGSGIDAAVRSAEATALALG